MKQRNTKKQVIIRVFEQSRRKLKMLAAKDSVNIATMVAALLRKPK